MLGFVHKRVLHRCHPALLDLLPLQAHGMALPHYLHSRQVESHLSQVNTRVHMYHRSLCNYILMYNRLPQEIVDLPSVSAFQTKLTQLAKLRAERGRSVLALCLCGLR